MAGKNNEELTKFYDEIIKEAMDKTSKELLLKSITTAIEELEPKKDDPDVRKAIETLRGALLVTVYSEIMLGKEFGIS